MNSDFTTNKWPDMTHPAHFTEFAELELKKILYMGPWFHIEPTLHPEMRKVKEFVYVDIQPRGENETLLYDESSYKKNFVKNLKTKCYYFGYELIQDYPLDNEYVYTLLKDDEQQDWEQRVPYINPHVFIFKNKYTRQTLKYYISTNFLYNMNPELRNDMCYADGLILSGYFPNKKILNYFTTPKTIIGFTETYFPHESELNDKAYSTSIIEELFNDENDTYNREWVSNYFLMSIHNGHIIKCNTIYDLHEKCEYEYQLRLSRKN